MVLEVLFNSEVALEVAREELVEVCVERLCVAGLSKAEVLIVCKLTKVFSDDVFKVVQDRGDSLDLV